MTAGSERRGGCSRRLAAVFSLYLGLAAGLAASCTSRPAPADGPAYRLYAPFIVSAPNQPRPATASSVQIDGVLQNGPDNQILVLRNHGNGPQRLGGWTVELQGSGVIYRFSGGIIPPFDGKIWLTTSRESRLSVFTLGYFPQDAGRRYIPGNVILLRDVAGNLIDRFEIRDIPDLPLPDPEPSPSPS